jgi:hypothetical protein
MAEEVRFDDEDSEHVDFGHGPQGKNRTFMSNAEAAILLENLVAAKLARPTE